MIKETVIVKKLSDISIGTKVKIHSLTDDHIVLKLMEMGCLPGEVLSVINKAPWGDPISILISGYLLSLRLDEAEKINVFEI